MSEEEENPFMVKATDKKEQAKEDFGTDELVSFMVTPDEATKLKDKPLTMETQKPHWEEAGTPSWEREFHSNKPEKDEVVDHDES